MSWITSLSTEKPYEERLEAENAALRAEVERLKYMSATEACALIPSIMEYCTQAEKQLAASQLEAKRLREALEASDNLLRDLPTIGGFYGLSVVENNEQALSSPTSTDALDAYVAEKTREETAECTALNNRLAKLLAETAVALKGEEAALTRHSWHDLPVITLAKMVEISELTRQRDLAVSALEYHQSQTRPLENTMKVLAAIKESES